MCSSGCGGLIGPGLGASNGVFCSAPVASPSAIALLDVVSLLVDVPEHGLARGALGTVVEELGDEFFEVEFSDESGRTCGELALSGAVLQLRHRGDIGDDPDLRSDQEWLREIHQRSTRSISGEAGSEPWPAVRDALLAELKQRRGGRAT